jgi:D-alanine-D-alanine ligase
MNDKIKVGVLFGGRSAEHEVSLRSARTVVSAIDTTKYEVILIGLDRDGQWYLGDSSQKLLQSADISPNSEVTKQSSSVALIPTGSDAGLLNMSTGQVSTSVDVLFPVLHGPYGEDGTIQGFAKLANIACVGAGVLGSAVGMDKDVMKRLLRDAELPIGDFVTGTKNSSQLSYAEVSKRLGSTVFIKPANLGSSVGVSKVSSEAEFSKAIQFAFQYDRKVIIEQFIDGREIECAVLGNDEIEVSLPGEIVANSDFYSYDAKYAETSTSESIIPADLPPEKIKEVQELARKTFRVLECRGLARVDFFYTAEGNFLVNEINTLPGFTSISMYPKLWEASGVPLSDLVDRLIQLALQEYSETTSLMVTPK